MRMYRSCLSTYLDRLEGEGSVLVVDHGSYIIKHQVDHLRSEFLKTPLILDTVPDQRLLECLLIMCTALSVQRERIWGRYEVYQTCLIVRSRRFYYEKNVYDIVQFVQTDFENVHIKAKLCSVYK